MINSTNNEVSYNCSSDLSSFHIQDSFKSIIIIYRQMTFINSDTLTTPPQDSAFLYHEWTRIMISNVCNKELSRKLEVNKKFSFFVTFNSTIHFIDSTFLQHGTTLTTYKRTNYKNENRVSGFRCRWRWNNNCQRT